MRHFTLLATLALASACAPLVASLPPTPVPSPPTAATAATNASDVAPDSIARRLLVDVTAAAPSLAIDARYATPNNFTGAPLPGYEANRVLLRREAANALARVQHRALAEGYTLKVFDGYRPVRATLAMVDWTKRVKREDLIDDGYIAARSRHNLGLAVDLTLADSRDGRELEMGTPYDTFSGAAHTASASGAVARNRATLVRLMEGEGFVNYDKEWWHFSYDVPDPLRFDLVIRQP